MLTRIAIVTATFFEVIFGVILLAGGITSTLTAPSGMPGAEAAGYFFTTTLIAVGGLALAFDGFRRAIKTF